MSRRARRHVRVPPDLTSLFDVLFIVIFAALIRAAAVQQAAAAAAKPPAPAPPPPPAPVVRLESEQLHERALADLDEQLAARPTIIVRIAEDGRITAIETPTQVVPADTALLLHDPDPDIALAYAGDRTPEHRACRLAADRLGVADLASYLVIFAPAQKLVDLPHALYDGLRRDVERCLFDQKGLAVVVDPTVETIEPPGTP